MNKIIFAFFLIFSNFAFAETVVVLPQKFQNKKVVTVNSNEFNKLIQNNKDLELQLQQEAKNWELFSTELDRKLQESYKINNEMIREIEKLKETKLKIEKQLAEKDLAILQRNILIGALISLIALYCYLKFFLHIPFL